MGAYTVKIPDDLELAYLAKLGYQFGKDTIPSDVPGTIQAMLDGPVNAVLKEAALLDPDVITAKEAIDSATASLEALIIQKADEIKPK